MEVIPVFFESIFRGALLKQLMQYCTIDYYAIEYDVISIREHQY